MCVFQFSGACVLPQVAGLGPHCPAAWFSLFPGHHALRAPKTSCWFNGTIPAANSQPCAMWVLVRATLKGIGHNKKPQGSSFRIGNRHWNSCKTLDFTGSIVFARIFASKYHHCAFSERFFQVHPFWNCGFSHGSLRFVQGARTQEPAVDGSAIRRSWGSWLSISLRETHQDVSHRILD